MIFTDIMPRLLANQVFNTIHQSQGEAFLMRLADAAIALITPPIDDVKVAVYTYRKDPVLLLQGGYA